MHKERQFAPSFVALAFILMFGCSSEDGNIHFDSQSKKSENTSMNVFTKEARTTTKDFNLKVAALFEERKLLFTYTFQNLTNESVYILDSYPIDDLHTKVRKSDYDSFYLSSDEPSGVLLLKGVPPLPSGKQVAIRVMPLGTHIAAKQEIKRTIQVELPFKEQNNWYYGALKNTEYDSLSVDHLNFKLHYMRESVAGFSAIPTLFDPKSFIVKTKNTMGDLCEAKVTIDFHEMILLKRKDWFSRP